MPSLVGADERVFRLRDSAGMSAALWTGGGILLLALAAIGFGIAIISRIDQLTLHLITTLPTIMGIGLIYGSILTGRTPPGIRGEAPDSYRMTSKDRLIQN